MNKILSVCFVLIALIITSSFETLRPEKEIVRSLYDHITTTSSKPAFTVFEKAIVGFNALKTDDQLGDKNLLTIIDFTITSKKKRMWVIDIANKRVLHHTLVAHGKNTGEEFAEEFSNIPQSYQSSLGFYVTGNTYSGKHGLSLYLNGFEPGINDKARERAIVMHGAQYVSTEFIQQYGRLGRSLGCPALPMNKHKEIIPLIANKTCLFIYYPDNGYLEQSKLLKKNA